MFCIYQYIFNVKVYINIYYKLSKDNIQYYSIIHIVHLVNKKNFYPKKFTKNLKTFYCEQYEQVKIIIY